MHPTYTRPLLLYRYANLIFSPVYLSLFLFRWSLQQKLFNPNESSLFPELHNSTEVYSIQDKLFTTVHGPNTSISYVFRSQGTSSWSLQSKLLSYNTSTDLPYFPNPDNVSDTSQTRPPLTSFTRPILWGGTLVYRADNEYHLRTPYRNDSCLQIWLSDHYRDGWDTAVLTVRAPDLTNDTFHPHCDQVEPFHVRYCPYSPDDEGVYIVKVFAATQARFYWEISWQVLEESTGKSLPPLIPIQPDRESLSSATKKKKKKY